MKFFVPAARDSAMAEDAWRATRRFLADQGCSARAQQRRRRPRRRCCAREREGRPACGSADRTDVTNSVRDGLSLFSQAIAVSRRTSPRTAVSTFSSTECGSS
jgi:hypothetical protein